MTLLPSTRSRSRRLRKALSGLGAAVVWTLAAVGLFVVVFISFTMANGNFHTVARGEAFRSAQPSPAKLERYVRDHGIRTVINLRGANPSDAWYQEEVAAADQLGLNHIDFRMSARRGITNGEALQLIEIMRDAPKPLLIHCESGADRTGLASALYAAAIAGLGEEAAERHLSIRYGHVSAPFGKGWGTTLTWERMERALGFVEG
ncbi:dual specificity protein phosphatase family protein [Brevundimonas variabilis]|uniref:Protein tyrosine/serine phosphatase n=1 Tax=Brevundimonas variabilis TaxID=74312 RepID=A0A7W9CGH9_9CAUL|nr:dual specificity protein phosphatase family protein [Brevundimonas variabilis]MBB5745200.1 protein tyrosine/serine phosphatase [Brevundimonas variabilis]